MHTFLRTRPYAALFVLVLLGVLNIATYYYVFHPVAQKFSVSFLNVGQGDAILIESPTGVQVLVDGGRDRTVLRELPHRMGFFDRSIDLVVATHPDADHINGLADVLDRYHVQYFLHPGIENDTSPTARLEAKVSKEKGIKTVLARKGERIHIGDGAYIDVLYPDHDVRNSETNAGSIVLRAVYGETAVLLSGDLPIAGEDYLVMSSEFGTLRSTILKAGHHGSRTSSGSVFLEAVNPTFFVVSAGKDNSYGHPHNEVLERVRIAGATLISTIEEGTITFTSDGTSMVRE